MANMTTLRFKVLVELSGITAHARTIATAQIALGSSCCDLEEAPVELVGRHKRSLVVAAWCIHPDLIPHEKLMLIPEPPENFAGGNLFLRPHEIIHSKKDGLWYLVTCKLVEYQDWTDESSDESSEDDDYPGFRQRHRRHPWPSTHRFGSDGPGGAVALGPGWGTTFVAFPPANGGGPVAAMATGVPWLASSLRCPLRFIGSSFPKAYRSQVGAVEQPLDRPAPARAAPGPTDDFDVLASMECQREDVRSPTQDPMCEEACRGRDLKLPASTSVQGLQDNAAAAGMGTPPQCRCSPPMLVADSPAVNVGPSRTNGSVQEAPQVQEASPETRPAGDDGPTIGGLAQEQGDEMDRENSPHILDPCVAEPVAPQLESVRFDVAPVALASSPAHTAYVTTTRGTRPALPLHLEDDISTPVKANVTAFASNIFRPVTPGALQQTPPRRRARTPVTAALSVRRSERLAMKSRHRASKPAVQAQNVLMKKLGITTSKQGVDAAAFQRYLEVFTATATVSQCEAMDELLPEGPSFLAAMSEVEP
ncbi:unnamed protein product [Urochloa humidicola]